MGLVGVAAFGLEGFGVHLAADLVNAAAADAGGRPAVAAWAAGAGDGVDVAAAGEQDAEADG